MTRADARRLARALEAEVGAAEMSVLLDAPGPELVVRFRVGQGGWTNESFCEVLARLREKLERRVFRRGVVIELRDENDDLRRVIR